jgi:thiosulfate/3-mercaptopyruvate sulfurtransferase
MKGFLTGLVVLGALIHAPAPHRLPNAAAESPLVTPAWLAAHLSDPKLVVLHVGPAEDYSAAHVRGARFVSLRQIHAGHGDTPDELVLEMLPPDSLRTVLEGLGISDDSRVVVYFARDWVTPATRVLFTLNWAGLGDRAFLLDGGLAGWTAAGQKTTSATAPVTPGRLSPLHVRPLVVDAAYVNAHRHASGAKVVDGRSRSFYDLF